MAKLSRTCVEESRPKSRCVFRRWLQHLVSRRTGLNLERGGELTCTFVHCASATHQRDDPEDRDESSV